VSQERIVLSCAKIQNCKDVVRPLVDAIPDSLDIETSAEVLAPLRSDADSATGAPTTDGGTADGGPEMRIGSIVPHHDSLALPSSIVL
jgi:hypothetical protein